MYKPINTVTSCETQGKATLRLLFFTDVFIIYHYVYDIMFPWIQKYGGTVATAIHFALLNIQVRFIHSNYNFFIKHVFTENYVSIPIQRQCCQHFWRSLKHARKEAVHSFSWLQPMLLVMCSALSSLDPTMDHKNNYVGMSIELSPLKHKTPWYFVH